MHDTCNTAQNCVHQSYHSNNKMRHGLQSEGEHPATTLFILEDPGKLGDRRHVPSNKRKSS